MAGLINKSLPFTSDGYFLVAGEPFGLHTQILPSSYAITYMVNEAASGKLECDGVHLSGGYTYHASTNVFNLVPVDDMLSVQGSYSYHSNTSNFELQSEPCRVVIQPISSSVSANVVITPINNFL